MGINPKVKAVFLDRDGVLNNAVIVDGKPYPPKSVNELVIPEGVKEGLKQLKELDYLLIVITNQPDVARGTTPMKIVDDINNYLKQELIIDDFFCCVHDNADNCECRKPKPGMIQTAAKKWNIDLDYSFMVGDRWRDIETGKNAGVKTILIDLEYKEKNIKPDYNSRNFLEATQIIISLT
ncbi:MAG: HAD family hydrolase [Bacteroidales bacterium]|nr:HAD family hydrolase [Bacteroidales bacterium]